MIKNTFPDKSGNPENLKKSSQQFKSFSTNVLIVGEDLLRAFYRLFYWSFKWSVRKYCVVKILLEIWEIVYIKIIIAIFPTDLLINFFILFLAFLTKQKQEPGFQQVGGLVTRNISVACL